MSTKLTLNNEKPSAQAQLLNTELLCFFPNELEKQPKPRKVIKNRKEVYHG